MAAVDPLFAQWLQAPALYAVRTDPGGVGRWASTALTTERDTGIASRVAAEIEGDRQLAFFSRGPFAIDVHQLLGTDWQACIGLIISVSIDQLDYDAGVDVMVLKADPDQSTGLSQVTVLRPLRGGL